MQRLFDCLYQKNKSRVVVRYSNNPSAKINISRLLESRPAFEHEDEHAEIMAPLRKILIISPEVISEEQPTEMLLVMLKRMGFVIKKTNELPELNEEHASIKEAAKALNCSIDEIYWLDPESINRLLEENDNYWRKASLSEINLNDNPVSQEAFVDLINRQDLKHIKKVSISHCPRIVLNSELLIILLTNTQGLEELYLRDCNNINWDGLQNIALPNLKKLNLSNSTINIKSLNALLKEAKQLEDLDLCFCHNINEGELQSTALPNLKKLNLSYSTINIKSLNALLKEAKQLEELDLCYCHNINWDELQSTALPNLKKLGLVVSTINTTSLNALLKKAPQLEELNLHGCKNLNEGELQNIALPNLKKLVLSYSAINTKSLNVLLKKAPQLEELNLDYCNNINWDELQNIALPNLKKLYLYYSTINTTSLNALLKEAKQLEELNLRGCNNINWDELQNIALPNLKKLNLSDSNITIKSLNALLKEAPQLEELNLYYCKNLNEGELQNIALPNLKKLYLSGSNITIKSLNALLKEAKQLEELDLRGCKNIDLSKLENIPSGCRVMGTDSLPSSSRTQVMESTQANNPTKQIDADTTNENSTHHVKLEFIGHPKNPDIRMIRHESFNQLTFASSQSMPFELSNSKKSEAIATPPPQQSKQPLFEVYESAKKSNNQVYFGRFSVKLNKDWQRLPSIHGEEIISDYYCKEAVDIKKFSDGYYYIKPIKQSLNKKVRLEIILTPPKETPSIDSLPHDIQGIIRDLRSYRDTPIEYKGGEQGEDCVQKIIEKRTGACRHRAVAFKYLVAKSHPKFDVNITTNGCHAFVEINHEGHWINVDLGGYASNLTIDKSQIPEYQEEQTDIIQQRPPSLIQTKRKIDRTLPAHRYFETLSEHMAYKAAAKVLFKTSHVSDLRYELQQRMLKESKPVFYIHNPDELICGNDYINDNGEICKGPGGKLYDFLTQQPNGTLIINYDNFSSTDIAKFNSVIDEARSINSVSIPESMKVIGLINPKREGAYQGSDFYSRFDVKVEMPIVNSKAPMPEAIDVNKKMDIENIIPIELYESSDWEGILLGRWQLDNNVLTFQEGKLISAIKENKGPIQINNPPANDPDFIRFWHDFNLYQGIYHRGRLLQALNENQSITLAQHQHLNIDDVLTDKSKETSDTNILILNPQSFESFFGTYLCDDSTKTISKAPGLLAKHQGKILHVGLTGELSIYQWMALIDEARRYNVSIHLSVAPGINIPFSYQASSLMLAENTNTQCIRGVKAHDIQFPKDAIIIDISELEPSILLGGIDGKYRQDLLKFEFYNLEHKLDTWLKDGKTVILKGQWPNEMSLSLHAFIAARMQNPNSQGQLTIIDDEKSNFSFMASSANPYPLKEAPKPIQASAEFDARLETVNEILNNNPFVLLTGPTGAGKTHFINHEWAKAHPNCHYGEQNIKAFAEDKSSGLKTLFIDEANLANSQWSLFEGLFHDPPHLWINGQYYKLTPEHKVIFAGNPTNYGGERHKPSLFEHHKIEVQFKPIPFEAIHLDDVDANIKSIFRGVYDALVSYSTDDVLITPREVLMMAKLTKAITPYCSLDTKHIEEQVEEHVEERVAKYIAYHLAKHHVPKVHQNAFDTKFKSKPISISSIPKLKDFTCNQTNKPTVIALMGHLLARELNLPGGLGGLVIEGEPGMGKSEIVTQLLVARNLIENQDFIRIPVNMDYDKKVALLLKAFHEGKIVIIDEINASPMIERLVNALLEGHDLDNNKARKPGFMLIGTQNPTTYQGRLKMTAPLAHRLQTVVMPNYTKDELQNIVQNMGVPPKIARDMVAEFQRHENLCPRDLFRCARKWLETIKPIHIPSVAMEVQPQNGSLCKLLSISNIENYFARKNGYKPIPLRKNATQQLSIRKLAKDNGSLQGEVLSFKKWQENFQTLGYEADVIDFKDDFNLFLTTIITALQQGNLPLIAFPINKDTHQPETNPQNPEQTEHSAIITGYNPTRDTVTIAHWGTTYEVDLVTLFNANQKLNQTREQESYLRNRFWNKENKSSAPKYLPADKNTPGAKPTPKPIDAGFYGKILVVKDPRKALDRTELINEYQRTLDVKVRS